MNLAHYLDLEEVSVRILSQCNGPTKPEMLTKVLFLSMAWLLVCFELP